MISPGLLCSGPVRTVVDMLNSANGRVTASDVLAGVLQRPGDGGPALAADVFAAFVAAAASGEAERGDSEGAGLRSQVSQPCLRLTVCFHRLFGAAQGCGGVRARCEGNPVQSYSVQLNANQCVRDPVGTEFERYDFGFLGFDLGRRCAQASVPSPAFPAPSCAHGSCSGRSRTVLGPLVETLANEFARPRSSRFSSSSCLRCPRSLQATAWLGGALSASHTHHDRSGGLSMGMDSSTAEAALARHMIRRVPFEAKPVLLAVQEAAELAAAGGGLGASSPRHTGKRKHVPGKGKGPGGLTVVASLLKAARAAMQSPLLPLPVPVSPPPAAHPGRGHSGGTSGARDLPVDGGPINSPAGDGDGEAADAPPASVTAELLLSTFVQSQAEVRRSLREAIQQA